MQPAAEGGDDLGQGHLHGWIVGGEQLVGDRRPRRPTELDQRRLGGQAALLRTVRQPPHEALTRQREDLAQTGSQ
jgi:hypothetical protein